MKFVAPSLAKVFRCAARVYYGHRALLRDWVALDRASVVRLDDHDH
jgi:hypothetical protein